MNIQQGHMHYQKVIEKTFTILLYFYCIHNFLFVKESLEKRITLSTKILRIFLSTKSANWNGFEGSCDTEDWSNDADNSITGQ